MTGDAMPNGRPRVLEPVDEAVDRVRGPAGGRLILEYGDYECPYSRQAFRQYRASYDAAALLEALARP